MQSQQHHRGLLIDGTVELVGPDDPEDYKFEGKGPTKTSPTIPPERKTWHSEPRKRRHYNFGGPCAGSEVTELPGRTCYL